MADQLADEPKRPPTRLWQPPATGAAGHVSTPAALAIGVLGAGVAYAAMQIRSRTRLDDALDVFSCHGMAGITGALLTGVFASKAANPAGGDGLLAGNAAQLGVQAVAVLAAVAVAAVGTAAIYGLLRLTMTVRADAHEEISGLDLTEHGEEAYFGGDAGGTIGLGHSVIVSPHPPAAAPPAGALPATS